MADRYERGLVWAIIGCLLVAITVPYVLAWHSTPAGSVYTGLLWLPDDQNVHVTWARQGLEGHFLLPNLYSTDSIGKPAMFSNLVMYVIGRTAWVTRIPLILVYHIYRLLFAAGALWVFWRLTRLLTGDWRVRVGAAFLAAFSAGAGWMWLALGLDGTGVKLMDLPRGYLFVPEAYTFASGLIYPLNVASMMLMAGVYYLALRGEETRKMTYAVAGGFAAMILGNSHTYDSIPLMGTLGAYALVRLTRHIPEKNEKRWWWGWMVIAGMGMIPVVVQAWLYFYNPEFRWSKTHYPVNPLPIGWTVLSFGWLMPLAAWGAWVGWSEKGVRFMAIWAGVTFVEMYSPFFDFGRKLIEGVQLPLVFLAAVGGVRLIEIVARRFGRAAWVAGIAVLLSTAISPPVMLAGIWRHRVDESWPAPRTPLDVPADYEAAVRYLRDLPREEKDQAVVLAMPPLANHIPPQAGVRVFVGHWAESIRFVSKFWTAHHFFDGTMSEEDAKDFLKKNHITHVLANGADEEKGWAIRVGGVVFEQGNVRVYRVGKN
ncbi:MAG TPA: hypothetical protein VFE58_15270 [Tepidisphaeraceae bacterium]|nr:hypothetical protein [Tepidisphaeraceae bacterium]